MREAAVAADEATKSPEGHKASQVEGKWNHKNKRQSAMYLHMYVYVWVHVVYIVVYIVYIIYHM